MPRLARASIAHSRSELEEDDEWLRTPRSNNLITIEPMTTFKCSMTTQDHEIRFTPSILVLVTRSRIQQRFHWLGVCRETNWNPSVGTVPVDRICHQIRLRRQDIGSRLISCSPWNISRRTYPQALERLSRSHLPNQVSTRERNVEAGLLLD